MSKRTEKRLTSTEREIYNQGQSLIKQGKEKMEKAKALAEARVKAEEAKRKAEEEKRLALVDAARRAQLILQRNDQFRRNVEQFVKDVRTTAAAYKFELNWNEAKSVFDMDAPFCDVSFRFRPKV